MAVKTYIANQVRRSEVQKATVTAVAVGGTAGISINGKVVNYICVTGDTTSTAATNLAAAIKAATDPEFQQFAVSVDSTTTNQLNFVANEPGIYISADGNTAITPVSAGGTTVTSAVVTAGKSPADASDVLNWSGGALPANTNDDWVFEDGPFPAWYSLAALVGKTPLTFTVKRTFSGAGIGLPKFNQAGYEEYRGGRLTVAAMPALTIDIPDGAGAESFRFDVGGTTACVLRITGAGNNLTVGQEVVDWLGTHANSTAEVDGGSLKVASYVGEVATLLTLNLVKAACTLGSGVTLGTLVCQNSGLDMSCACTTMTVNGDDSSVVVRGSGAITTLTVDGGKVFHNGTGTISTLTVGPDATIDFSGSKLPITVTAKALFHKGCTVWDPYGRVTWTAGYQTVRCADSECTINLGTDRSYTVT